MDEELKAALKEIVENYDALQENPKAVARELLLHNAMDRARVLLRGKLSWES